MRMTSKPHQGTLMKFSEARVDDMCLAPSHRRGKESPWALWELCLSVLSHCARLRLKRKMTLRQRTWAKQNKES